MTDVISSDAVFSETAREILRRLAALMIPESGALPSAADGQIFAGILDRLTERSATVSEAIARLDELAAQSYSRPFAGLPADEQFKVLESLDTDGFRQVFQMAALTAYYQDDRVMVAIGLPPRPAWPEGYEINSTDWSILEPVRARGPLWRNAPD